MQIGRQAVLLDQLFAGLAAQGVGLWVGFQALITSASASARCRPRD